MSVYFGPVRNIPQELRNDYTMDGKVVVLDWWFDGRDNLVNKDWTIDYIKTFTDRFTRDNIISNKHKPEPYENAALFHCQALDKYVVVDKHVAVIGSTTPWIEAILLNYGCTQITTVEYNVPKSTHPCIHTVHYADFEKTNVKYDMIITYSSLEHSGLGRYGDTLDPNADITAMNVIYEKLSDDGVLLWGAPVGKDTLVWNAHRIYGRHRLALMFEKYNIIEWIGHSQDTLNNNLRLGGPEPVIVAKPKR